MIRTAAEAVVEVGAINRSGFGAIPDYGEFIQACKEAVALGIMVVDADSGRREFWLPEKSYGVCQNVEVDFQPCIYDEFLRKEM